MRFRTDVVPVVLIVSATAVTMPLVEGCKKQDTTADASNVPIIIKRKEEIPSMPLGGAAMPYIPPAPSASAPPASQAPAQGTAGAAAAAAPAAAEPAAAPVTSPAPTAIAIAHDHPPDQPCNHPLKREEVEKALSDLQSKK